MSRSFSIIALCCGVTVACDEPGDSMIVTGPGLAGDGTAAAPLQADFDGDGTATQMSRSDHVHAAPEIGSGELGTGVTIPGAQVTGVVADSAGLGGKPAAAYALASEIRSPWVACGFVADLVACNLPSFPGLEYEYGSPLNINPVPVPIACTMWNVGMRVYNATPIFVESDNPSTTMLWGGSMYYTGTNATDDDVPGGCPAGQWRHRYWYLGADNVVQPDFSLGCGNLELYCRRR